jgi:hypothetical protein
MFEKRPAAFLDLPLELRQIIYGYVLPEDRVVHFPASQQRSEAQTITAICTVVPHLKREVKDVMFKECDVHISVKPDKEMEQRWVMEWERFRRITIQIDHYQDFSKLDEYVGMRQIISQLRSGQPELLPGMTIQYREDSAFYEGDAMWTEAMPHRSVYCWHQKIGDCYVEGYGSY